MSEKIIEVQVQGDFLDRLTSARPVQALAELIWNAVDADATDVNITLEQGNLGLDAIIVADNGHGIPYDKAEGLFGSLGGSWKRQRRESQGEKRALHGEDGKGRFRALALGRTAEWNVRTPELNGFLRYSITIIKDNPRRAIISDATTSPKATGTGVVVRIIELHKNWKLDDEKTFQELSEVFALYLTQYPHVAIHFEKRKIDPPS
jgi:DNA topoisomerase VI subunit B